MSARARVFSFAMLMVLSISLNAWTQNQSDPAVALQRATAEKFLQLLLNRPQPGTALDKTIEYYQSVGELNALCERIETQAKELQTTQPEVAARHWLTAALMAQSQSRWLESIDLLRRAPDVAQHRWAIGQTQSVAWEQLQRWPEAISVLQPLYQQVLEEPGQTSAESVIDCSRRLAKAFARTGQSKQAIDVWKKLEARFGRDVQIATRLATMAADEGELEFAVEVLDRVLTAKLPATKRMELAIQRTSLMARAGHEQAAIDNYQQLLSELNADSWLATDIARRIEELIVGRDGVGALLQYYRKQVEQRPDDLQVRLRLAVKLDSEKQWGESGRLFQQLIERTTTAFAPRLAYAQSLIHQERWRDAATEFAKLAEQQPRNDDILMQWCEAISADVSLNASERCAQVGNILEKRLEGTPPTASAYQQVASQLQRFGLAERASVWLAKARQLQPNDLSVLADYSRALLDLGREPEILQAISTFAEANHSNREQLSQLSELYGDLGFGDLAIECLLRACQLGATSTMRYRLAEWLEKSQRQSAAAEQLHLAWQELAAQTTAPSEQETLCEEITRRQILLALRSGKLNELLEKSQAEQNSNSARPALAGVDANAVMAWRTAKFLMASGQLKLADETLAPALQRNPRSTMLWRLRAEMDENANRLPESVQAHRKLAELDVRRRSDHLLQVAKGLARLGQVDAALKLTEAITTETASSQHIIEVFNLALETKSEKFARNLLERRLQTRPGDIDVLQRLIRYHLDNHAYQQAADYQWQNLQLMRTPEQRQAAVELLIETHFRLHTLHKLEQQLERYWRQHDLWREFGVWQAMIALKGDNYLQAEKLLARLAESQTTRRFAIESSLKLAEQQGHSLKRFEFMKKLAALDSQAISADAVAKVLISLPDQHRSPALVRDALELVRGTSKRLALIQDLIQSGNADMALRIIDGLPETERQSWPIVARTALLWAALSIDSNAAALAHVKSAATQLHSYTQQPLDLPETLAGQRMLEELLDGQEFIDELLLTTTVFRVYKPATLPINAQATNCHSALQTYQAIVAAQLRAATTPAERRDILAEHRRVAMQQADLRERAVRLAAMALASHWHSKVPDLPVAASSVQPPSRLTPKPGVDSASSVLAKLRNSMAAKLPLADATIVSRLAIVSSAFQYTTVEFEKLASQGDPLASLLSLWILEASPRDILNPNNASILNSVAANCSHLGEYAEFAPAQIITLMAMRQLRDRPEQNSEYLTILSRLNIGKDELKRAIAIVLEQKQPALIQSLIASRVGKSNCLELIGELAASRNFETEVDPTDLWRAVDYVWQSEVQHGLRLPSERFRPDAEPEMSWTKTLPLCSVLMHDTPLFHDLDFNVVRSVIARAHSTTSRQELLKVIKQLADEPVASELRLVRQLAQVFALELLEQDAQSTRLLDEVLPPEISANEPMAVLLRGTWLDVIGKRDAAIEWWLKFHQWPNEQREAAAALMLQMAMERHHDDAIDVAVKELRAATSDLLGYHSQVDALIARDMLPQAETLLGEFRVLLPPTDKPLVVNAQLLATSGVSVEVVLRWSGTDLLFKLLQKYSKAADKEAVHRITRRLITGAETASDPEFREHLSNLLVRIERAYQSIVQLTEFLELESHRTDLTPRESLCLLRLISDAGYKELAQQIVDRMPPDSLDALQCLELARCALKLGKSEGAAQYYARAFELEPEWMESSAGELSESSSTIAALAQALNSAANAGAGVGSASMHMFLKVIPAGQLSEFSELWCGWASNSRPKTLEQIRSLLSQLRKTDFTVWLRVVEQLLLTDELQPSTVAFDNAQHWMRSASHYAVLEQQLLETRFEPAENAQFQAMLERVLAKSKDHFLARLMLTQNYLSAQDQSRATEQLDLLLRCIPSGAIVKDWLMFEWQAELRRVQSTSGANINANSNANATNRGNAPAAGFALSAATLDKAARAKLLLHLLNNWNSSPMQSGNRVQLGEQIVELNGFEALPATQQDELFKYYLSQQDEGRFFNLLDKVLARYQAGSRTFASFSKLLNSLAKYGTAWQRHLIMVRVAQLEQRPLQLSTAYALTQEVDRTSIRPKLVYPLQQPAEELIEKCVEESRRLLPAADWNPGNVNSWATCFQPRVVFDSKKQTIEVVSMLDTLWPAGQNVSNEARTRIDAALQNWRGDLASLGRWQTLALHELAARLGDEPTVQQTQERLLEMAKAQETNVDRPWRVALWSAVRSSQAMASQRQNRFRLGEIARHAVFESGTALSDIYSLMTIAQIEESSIDWQLNAKDPAVEEMVADLIAAARQSRGLPRTADEIDAQLKINLMLFQRLVTVGQADLAIDILLNMRGKQLLVGVGDGVLVAASVLDPQPLNVLDSFQHMIDNGQEPERLQALLETLLLRPLPVEITFRHQFPDFGNDFPGLASRASNGEVLKWSDEFDPNQSLHKTATDLNMFKQLVQLARINNTQSQLYTKLVQDREKRTAHLVCRALIDLEEGRVSEALDIYRELLTHAPRITGDQSSVQLVRDSIFNAVQTDPLSDTAIEFASLLLQRPLDTESVGFLRRQFRLATARNRNSYVENNLENLAKATTVPLHIRDALRVEYAYELLKAGRTKDSLLAYMKGQTAGIKHYGGPNGPLPDLYLLELMNRLPSLGDSEQADIFQCFCKCEAEGFPWLVCYELPATQSLPERFRRSNTRHGLVLHALDQRRSWISFLSWIADYAESTAQKEAAISAATSLTINQTEVIWGAAILTARLNPQLSPGALKNRLSSTSKRPSMAELQALSDNCQASEPLRAAAVEIIVNLGFPGIALAAPLRVDEPPGWKHWLVMREETLTPSTELRPRWSLSSKGQWTAQSSVDNWYLMLRYPLAGDFQLSVTAQQASGSKFGIGGGGMAIAQHGDEPIVRCLGVGARRAQDLIPTEFILDNDIPLQIERQGSTWKLQAANVSFAEQANDSVPFIYLLNQGPGSARLDSWQITNDLKIARQVDLLDVQLRMWRPTLGPWKLPTLRVKNAELDGAKPGIVHLSEGILHLPPMLGANDSSLNIIGALHCLRPLLPDETVSYEFYAAADTAAVYPALGRMVLRWEGERVMLQWLMRADDDKWLGLRKDQLFALADQEVGQAVKIKADAWNKVDLSLVGRDGITLAINGQSVANIPLPARLATEFGLSVSSNQPAKVRNVILTGPWPEKLSLEKLTE